MQKIVTVTPNTACDWCIEVDRFNPGDNIVAKSSVEFASGKGVNVARAVDSLGGRVHALGFVGRESQALFEAIGSARLTTDFCRVVGRTRTNITLLDTAAHRETHIRTPGFSVTGADCERLLAKLDACIDKNDIVVLSGSLPAGAPATLYQTMIVLCRRKSAFAFLDTSGESLMHGLKAGPDLIKPNQSEFEACIGRRLDSERAIVAAARPLLDQGVGTVIVSRGEQGVVVVTEERVLSASVNGSAEGAPVSTIGCGDALVGAVAFARLHGREWTDTIRLAVACGAANLFSAEPGRFEQGMLRRLEPRVVIRCL